MNKKTIGQFIAVLRKAKGMTQQEMADRLGVSNKAVSRWERDECAPDISLIPAISEMFEVSCDELLRGERIADEDINGKLNKGNVKSDKQLKLLVKNTLSKFKNVILISTGISVAGYILMLGISYGFYRPQIGFPIMMLFEVAAFIIATIYVNKTKEVRNENELFEKIEEAELVKYNKTIGSYGYLSYFLSLTAVVLSIPLIGNYSEYIKSVLAIESYLPYVGILLIVLGGVFFLIKKPVEGLISGVKSQINPIGRKQLLTMNGIQMSSLILLVLVYILEIKLSEKYEHLWPVLSGAIIGLLVINVVTAIVFLVKFKEVRKRLIVPAIRNVLLYFPIAMIINSTVVIYSDGISMYFDSSTIVVAILLILGIFVVARIVQLLIDFKGK